MGRRELLSTQDDIFHAHGTVLIKPIPDRQFTTALLLPNHSRASVPQLAGLSSDKTDMRYT